MKKIITIPTRLKAQAQHIQDSLGLVFVHRKLLNKTCNAAISSMQFYKSISLKQALRFVQIS